MQEMFGENMAKDVKTEFIKLWKQRFPPGVQSDVIQINGTKPVVTLKNLTYFDHQDFTASTPKRILTKLFR